MLTYCLALLMTVTCADPQADFLKRVAEAEEIVEGKSQDFPRIEKDSDGTIIRLRLDDMKLTEADFRALEKMTSLQGLSLRNTNVHDADLSHLRELKNLNYLVLTGTEVSDEAVPQIAKCESLKTICLGNVPMTPDGVKKLKEHFPKLSLGYFQRKT